MRFIRAHKPLFLLIAFIAFGLLACVRKPAVSESEKELLRAVQYGDYESAAYCLDIGVSPDITDIYEQSLLMLAVQDEYEDVIELLLSKGADVNYKINTRNTEGIQNVRNINTELFGLNVLYFAVQTGDTTIVDMLLKRGAELNPENESESPLLIASENLDYEMLGYLFRNKARVSDRIAWDILGTTVISKYQGILLVEESFFRVVDLWKSYQKLAIVPANLEQSARIYYNMPSSMRRYDREWSTRAIDDFMFAYHERHARIDEESPEEKEFRDQRAVWEKEKYIAQYWNDREIRKTHQSATAYEDEKREAREIELYNFSVWRNLVIGIVLMLCALVYVYNRYGLVRIREFLHERIFKKVASFINRRTITGTQTEEKPALLQRLTRKKELPENPKGWSVDNTFNIKVDILTIEDMINPIRLCNEHEKAVRRMMWYMRRLEQHTDEAVAGRLGEKGLLPHLDLLLEKVDMSVIRDVYKRSLYLMVKDYGQRDDRVFKFLKRMDRRKKRSKVKWFFLSIMFILSLFSFHSYAQQEAITREEKILLTAVEENKYKETESFLRSGLSANLTDEYGVSLLMKAIENKDQKMIGLLIRQGANVNYRIDNISAYTNAKVRSKLLGLKGTSVLDFAVDSRNTVIVDLLLEKGAILNLKDEMESPLVKASQNKDYSMLIFLSDKGARVSRNRAEDIAMMAIDFILLSPEASSYFMVIKFWEDHGVEITEDNLSKSAYYKFYDHPEGELSKFVKQYDIWKKEEAVRLQEQEGLYDDLNLYRLDVDSLITAHQRQQESENEEESLTEEEASGVKAPEIIMIVILSCVSIPLFVYVRYGSFDVLWKTIRTKFVKKPVNPNPQPVVQPKPVREARPIKPVQTPNKQPRNNLRGWSADNTFNIKVDILTIEDMINPIRLCNEHEKAVRRMMWYMRRLEQHTDEAVAGRLGEKGLLPHLNTLWRKIDVSMVRDVYKRSFRIMVENYGTRDDRVLVFLETMTKKRNSKVKKKR